MTDEQIREDIIRQISDVIRDMEPHPHRYYIFMCWVNHSLTECEYDTQSQEFKLTCPVEDLILISKKGKLERKPQNRKLTISLAEVHSTWE